MKRDCTFCNLDFKYESIKEYDYWDLQLFRDDQYYIGRMVAVFRKNHIVDVTDLNEDARSELFDVVISDAQKMLDGLFDPDLYNYTSLGNDCRHLHIHIIPRYKEPKQFNDKTFVDEYWNHTYSQDYSRVKLDQDERKKLINALQDNLD